MAATLLRHRNWPHALLALLVMFFIATGILGADFGHHWDERPNNITPLEDSIRRGVLLPGRYIYPSVPYWLAFVSLLPELRHFSYADRLHPEVVQRQLIAAIETNSYMVRTRSLFVIVCSLALIWTYLLMLVWRRNPWEALLAAALLGLSWEVNYHSRWIAPDELMMMFSAATLLCCTTALQSTKPRCWLALGALAAGLATGSKFPGGLLLLPLMITTFFVAKQSHNQRWWHLPLLLILIFAGMYLLTTPATILDPIRFLRDVLLEMRLYATGHGGHTVHPGLPHLGLMLTYLGLVAFSPYWPIAITLFTCGLIGIRILIHRARHATIDRQMSWLLLPLTAAYLLYFSLQHVMLVRNLLILFPVLAILAAIGIADMLRMIGSRAARTIIIGLLLIGLTLNAVWMWNAAQSIRYRRILDDEKQFLDYLYRHPDMHVLVSDKLAGVRANAAKQLYNRTAPIDAVAFWASEVQSWDWLSNRFHYTLAVFGPQEVNFDYYAQWQGDDRIVVLPTDDALALGLFNAWRKSDWDWKTIGGRTIAHPQEKLQKHPAITEG